VSASEKDLRLTSTSYVVLGMLDWLGPSSPYRLERVLTNTIEDFFPVPHTSFYAEPARLAGAGYLKEEQERGGRRRKTYSLTAKGRKALREWVTEPETEFGQLRFPGMLKIFFGADPAAFALEQSEHHRELAEKFEAALAREGKRGPPLTPGRRAVTNTGIELHRWWAKRWREVAEEVAATEDGSRSRTSRR
jgi:PadR family transcriptional regulator AphA